MQVFKAYFLLLRNCKGTIILYTSVFLGIAAIMANINSGSGENTFAAEHLDIGVIDRDNGRFAKEITAYFGDGHDMKEMDDNEDTVLNELDWR